ncbi:MAG: polysaccharide biosynthesis C-terminal domain-containing protein [Candidatus Kryptoniota bacterium]
MNGILQWGGALVLVLLHFNVVDLIAYVMLSRLVTTIVLGIMIYRIMGWVPISKGLNLLLLKDILSFGGWAMVSQVVSPILQYAERFMLSGLIATSIVTFYVVPYEATSKMLVLSVGLVSALFPAMSEIHARGGLNQDFRRLYVQSERILVFAFLPIGAFLFMFTPEILKLWMGNIFAENAGLVFKILSLAFLVNAVAQLPFTVLQAVGRSDLTGKIHLIELPIHLLITFVMIQNFGLVGAAAATLVRIIMDAVLLYSFASRKLGLEIGILKNFWKTCGIPIASLVAGMACAFFPQRVIILKAILSLTSLLIYVLIVLRFSLQEDEKRFLMNVVPWRARA